MNNTNTFFTYNDKKDRPKPERSEFDVWMTQFIHEGLLLLHLGLVWVYRNFLLSLVYFLVLIAACVLVAMNSWHLSFVYALDPEFIGPMIVKWSYQFYTWQHTVTLLSLSVPMSLLGFGILLRFNRTKYQRIFEKAGLSTSEGKTPVLLRSKDLDYGRKELVFNGMGLSAADFEASKPKLEAELDIPIESIETEGSPRYIKIILSELKLPGKIRYIELENVVPLPAESFYVGVSKEGPITQSIAELPHAIIAGSTGNGKSVFFKQALMGLLQSSPNLQMYLIDLKNGLEMVDFSEAPNVKIIKTTLDAVKVLRELKKEMSRRFDWLEQKGAKLVDPKAKIFPRIVIGVDEASVLLMKRRRGEPEYELVQEARSLIDHISKLGRAAAIHLILATQKLSAEVLPTSVTENIAGRMCFKAETIHGSLLVVGTDEAQKLPDIPGRGVWSLGSKNIVVQAPFVHDNDVKSCASRVRESIEKNNSGGSVIPDSIVTGKVKVSPQQNGMSDRFMPRKED